MPLCVYNDREGGEWRVWLVVPASVSVSTLEHSYRQGWLCFERVNGTDRCRLAMPRVPPAWDALPDDRLDMLRRLAEPATRRAAPPEAADFEDTQMMETEQRDSGTSGPKSAIGGEDDAD